MKTTWKYQVHCVRGEDLESACFVVLGRQQEALDEARVEHAHPLGHGRGSR